MVSAREILKLGEWLDRKVRDLAKRSLNLIQIQTQTHSQIDTPLRSAFEFFRPRMWRWCSVDHSSLTLFALRSSLTGRQGMKINRLFGLLVSVVVLITVSGAARALWVRWHTYAEAVAACDALRTFRLALIAAEKVSRERGSANGLLGAPMPAPASVEVALERARGETDQALAAWLASLQPGTMDRPSERASVSLALGQLAVARRKIDAAGRLARTERRPEIVSEAVDSMFTTVDTLQPAISSIQSDLIQFAPSSAGQIAAARLLTELREYAGRLGSQFTPALTLGQPLSSEQEAAINREVGRIEELAELVATRIGHVDADASLHNGMRKIREAYFGTGWDLVNQVRGASRAHLPYGMSAAEFAARYVPAMQPIVELRDDELAAATLSRALALQQARLQLMLAVAYWVLLLLLAFVLMRAFRRKVIAPVVAVSRAFAVETQEESGGVAAGDIARLRQGVRQLRAANVENQLLQRQREQALDFIFHDLRAPLVSIVMLIESEKLGMTGVSEMALREHIQRQAQRTLTLMEDYLELVQTESSSLRMLEVDLLEIIVDAVDDAWALAQQRRISVVSDSEVESAPVLGKPSVLRRAISNLINNAIKFSDASGEVRIAVSSADQNWCVSVTDFGAGIAPELMPTLFEPFQRAKATGAHAAPGIGLGLAFVRTAVLRHGGTVSVSSTPGSGATFTLSLPILK